MRNLSSSVVVVTAVVCGACQTPQQVDEGALERLKTAPQGSYLSGVPRGLGEPVVVNRRDFVYALRFDDVGRDLAFVHHVSTHMEVTATAIEPLSPHFLEKINPSEFDCEDVVFVGDRVVVPSRQGTLRAFDRHSGKLITEVATGEGLLRVDLSPNGKLVAASSTEGRVLLFDAATLALIGEGKPHSDEVRGLAFRGDRLLSAGQDGNVVVSTVVAADQPLVRLPTTGVPTGERVFLTHVDGTRALATIRDARQTSSVITRAAVKRLDLPSRTDGSTLPVATAEGSKDLPAIDVGDLRLRVLDVGPVVAAVCDDCLPPGVELLLGQEVLARVNLVEDVAKDEIVARPVDAPVAGSFVVALADGARVVAAEKSIALPGPGTDLDVAASGAVVVAFSKERAERTFDINDAEKKGHFPPPSPQSGAAIVDVDKGALGQRFVNGHLGFTVTATLSPDGRTVATGGWDRRLLLWDAQTGEQVTERSFAWLVRRVRFAPDGHLLGVAAWTPVNALNEGDSDPSLLLYPVALEQPTIIAAH
jgi:WD40 repeat protein